MNYIEQNKEQFLEDLKGLIKIESYLKDPNVYPTPELMSAVEYMIALGEKEGFKTYTQPEGYYGWIEIGQGEELIGILGHVDVVPPGDELDKWTTPPFDMSIEGDIIRGRGTQDDKGPVMLGFYLMKSIVESGIELNKRIRLIFPTDEESFWRGVEKYKEDGQEIPAYGITPDASFPLVYSERELWEFKLKGLPTEDYVIEAGAALNVVPDKASFESFCCGRKIVKSGKSAHAMCPEEGDNAIVHLVNKIDNKEHELLDFIRNEVNGETNGQTMFGRLIEDDDKNLTVNLATLKMNKEGSEAAFDLRIPSTSNSKELEEILKAKLSEKYPNLTFEFYDQLPAVFISKDSDIVKALTESYEEVVGEKMIPQATGGATYARGMENIVAFGPYFEDSPNTEHQYNEHIRFSDFIKSFDIYSNLFNKFLNK